MRFPRNYKHPKLLNLIKDHRPQTVVEFGSWYGNSTVAMALAARDAKIENFRLYAVDTWLGSIENWKRESGHNSKKDMRLSESGRPQFYDRFIRNIKWTRVEDLVIPLSMTTDTAWRWLQWECIEADLLYIDASHLYEDVAADIDGAQTIMKKGGILCGDDYAPEGGVHKEGVSRAVNEKIGYSNIRLEGSFWWTEL